MERSFSEHQHIQNRTQNIVIVGGGSSGWVVAGYLTSLIREKRLPDLKIILIEAPNVPRIGVGESTVPSMRATLDVMGLKEKDFLKSADATFKQAIEFVGWQKGEGHRFYHPFDRRTVMFPDQFRSGWLSSDRSQSWNDYASAQAHLCNRNLAPRALDWPDYQSFLPYAYHINADRFADCLRDEFTARGVDHVMTFVEGYHHHENGDLKELITADGQTITADLFIDCTGMRGLLIGDAMGVAYQDYSDWLLCDRAVAFPLPYDQYPTDKLKPYTRSIAMKEGWSWEIPLQSRRGVGYVYSSGFCDEETAAQDLASLQGVDLAQVTPRHLKFRVGSRDVFWKNNVIAMGLSGGFIEPLESTAIYIVEAAATALCDSFPGTADAMPSAARQFNRTIADLYAEVRDFVNLHYVLSRRDDTAFWQAASHKDRRTDTIAELMELWQHKGPSNFDFPYTMRLFSAQSYEHLLYGMEPKYACGMAAGTAQITTPPDVVEMVNKGYGSLPEHRRWFGLNNRMMGEKS